ncbi:MAG: M23 family metallopeptidase [Labilithrix sp.]|nr:M23 family metallopeptidase [Labilithrix sp.]MCW5815742.1 M23 family metallopeptidase [Labilithrix sp.]
MKALHLLLALGCVPLLALGCVGDGIGDDDDDEDGGEPVGETTSEISSGVASPVPGRRVSFAYGVRRASYAAGYHTGDDYAAPAGTNVVAVRAGTIRWSNGNGGAYGQWIGLDADNGRTYVYCHLSARSVAVGAKVTAGQVIGKVGSTGNSTGPHLHFEDHPLGPFRYAAGRKPSWSGPALSVCVANSTYCGGPTSKVKGDVGALYRCNADGAGATKIEACAAGCQVNPGANDRCQ